MYIATAVQTESHQSTADGPLDTCRGEHRKTGNADALRDRRPTSFIRRIPRARAAELHRSVSIELTQQRALEIGYAIVDVLVASLLGVSGHER